MLGFPDWGRGVNTLHYLYHQVSLKFPKQPKLPSKQLNYLSKYYAPTPATCARRRPHPASSAPASNPFTSSGRQQSKQHSTISQEHAHIQMISIVQTKPTPRLLQLPRRQPFQRRLRRDRHENRQRHGAMREVQRCCSRAGRLWSIVISLAF